MIGQRDGEEAQRDCLRDDSIQIAVRLWAHFHDGHSELIEASDDAMRAHVNAMHAVDYHVYILTNRRQFISSKLCMRLQFTLISAESNGLIKKWAKLAFRFDAGSDVVSARSFAPQITPFRTHQNHVIFFIQIIGQLCKVAEIERNELSSMCWTIELKVNTIAVPIGALVHMCLATTIRFYCICQPQMETQMQIETEMCAITSRGGHLRSMRLLD